MSQATNGTKGRKAAIEAAAEKPTARAVKADGIPDVLKQRPQWVCWVYGRRKGTWTKVPLNPATGRNAKSDTPSTWSDFETALAHYREHKTDGVGYVFTADDPFSGVDLDDCRDPQTGELQPWAVEIISTLDSYGEVSPSGTGVKVWVAGKKPGTDCSKAYESGKVEIYDRLKYYAMTGHRLGDSPPTVNERGEQLAEVYRRVFGETKASPAEPSPGVNGHAGRGGKRVNKLKVKWSPPDGPLTDEDILKLVESGLDKKLTDLWNGSTAGHDNDHSGADAALCCKLLYWIGGADAGRVDRLFRQSKLMRAKWDERRRESTYGRRTIEYAIGVQTEYRPPQGDAEDPFEEEATPSGPGPGAGAEAGDAGKPRMAHAIILDYLRDRYRPVFRRGEAIYSQALRRDVKRPEAFSTPTKDVIKLLATAKNVPTDRKGQVKVNELPSFFASWARVAWGELVKGLPDEEQAEEVAEGAESEFRAKVGEGLLTLITIGEVIYQDGTQATRTERRSVLQFCRRFATGGRWQTVRDYSVWCRMTVTPDGRHVLQVAVRAELFQQIGYRPLTGMGQTMFARLCQNYGVGATDRATGRRAVVLADEFLTSLLPDLNEATNEGDTGPCE